MDAAKIPARFAALPVDVAALPEGTYAVFDDATSAWWEVSAASVRELCDLVESDKADAYSLWCASSEGTEIAAEYAEELGLND